MAAIGIVPIIVAGALTEYVVTNAHRDDVAKLETALIAQKASEIQSFIDNNLLTQTRVVVPFAPSLTIAPAAENLVLKQTLTGLPFIRSESFFNLDGMETARADRTHIDGYPSASSTANVSADPAFMTAKAGDYYLGPVSFDDGTPVATYASPVRTDTGEIIAVVVGQAALSSIQSIVAQAKIGETGYLYAVDESGAIIGGGAGLSDKAGSAEAANLEIVQRVITGNDVMTPAAQMRYTGATAVPVVAAGAFLPEYGSHWGLIAEWPTKEADAVTGALLIKDVWVLAGVLVAIIILSIIAALFVTRPIRELEAGTARVAQGKFDMGVSIRTHDELEELGESFNAMVLGLKQLEQLKDEFVFIAAHELRTPVAAMKGYLQLILDGTTGTISDATRDFIQKVIASNQRLIQLVNDLLEVARQQAGRLTIKVSRIALAPPIASVLDELKSLADEKSIVMKYDAPQSLPDVMADGDRVKEVVVNLVGNAIKYMGGSGAIAITHETNGANVITHIADTGLGMSKEAQAKLFEKFYRVQTDKTKDITGTGLGLFIVKQIIEKMNGTIWVDSEEGKGSTFSFSLPIAK